MATVRILAWRGIPSQVKATDDSGGQASRTLPDWFQQEIDRVAMRDGLVGTDEYLDGWAWSPPQEQPGPAAEVADVVVAYLVEDWRRAPGE